MEGAMILVTTTGKVGSEAARLLAKRGVPVHILAHHPGKRPRWRTPASTLSKAISPFRRALTSRCKAS
jgi:uncharacterized protein YbjT (DUF2867 family)